MYSCKSAVVRELLRALLALVVVSAPAWSQVRTGTYVGDGVSGRSITGLGFQPDIVIIKGNDSAGDATSAVLSSTTMPAGFAKPLKGDQTLLGNLVLSLDSDGFTVGSDRMVNFSGVTFYYAAFRTNDDIHLGTYTGTGAFNPVSGLGFSPDYVIVMEDGASRAIHHAYHGFDSASFDQDAYSDAVLSMDADGFSLGANTHANESSRTYHFVAWNEVPQRVKVGWYFGDGVDDRAIGLGFRPDYAIVKAIDSIDDPVQRFAPMTGDTSVNFQENVQPDQIQAFSSNGFQVGTDSSVNNGSTSYFYVAFANGGGLQLGTTEAPGEITVTAPNYFDLKFSTASGGGIQEFHDLAAGPAVNNYDLAGGNGSIDALFFDTIAPVGTWHNVAENDIDARLQLLEATATRVRVRQEAFYQEEGGVVLLSGVKGFGDYSVYTSGRVALRWERRTTKPVSINVQQMGLSVHRISTGPAPQPISTWQAYAGAGNEFILTQIHDLNYGTYTDFLQILYRDWSMAEGHVEDVDTTAWFVSGSPNDWGILAWDEGDGQPLPPVERWDSVIDFKPTDFADAADPKVLARRDDYRGPDTLSISIGAPWIENPADGDHYNESEAAYTLDMDPAAGLRFAMNGASKTRRQPFFKVRRWRSLDDPVAVSLDGAPLANGTDFKADVKPVARAHFADDLLWHSTFEDAAAVAAPDVGSPAAVNGGTAFVPAKYGNGAMFVAPADFVSFPVVGDLIPARGSIELWYQPSYYYADASTRRIWTYFASPSDQFRLTKTALDNLEFDIVHGGAVTRVQVLPAAYGWYDAEWVHLRVSWDAGAPLNDQVRVFVNGLEPPHIDPVTPYPGIVPGNGTFYIGSNELPTLSAAGLIDELRIYGAPFAPRPLAHGGLSSSPNEFLGTGTRDFTMPFNVVDGLQRGEYFYVGSDARFRGLNVLLATKGAGATDLAWEFWDGLRWSNLESVAGFTDETVDLTRDGAIHWDSNPPGWAEYSVNGSTDLFYVRAHLQSGSYFTFPTERVIKTDILLFQYRGNITGAAQIFDFGLPPAVDVAISSASNQSFVVGATPAIVTSTIAITDNRSGGITAGNDLRIRIPAGFFMRWDETVLNATRGGTAALKVAPGIKAYEDNGRTVVLDVTADFAAGDQLTVDDLKFESFTAPSPLDNLELEVENDNFVSAFDDKTIVIAADGIPNLSSNDHQVFAVGQPPTMAVPIFVTEAISSLSITDTNDIRIHVPASLSMQWDPAVTTVSVSGSAVLNVGSGVTYEDGNRTVVIDVTTSFAAGDFIAITGLQFSNFTLAGLPDSLGLEVDNLGTIVDLDDKTIEITEAADVLFFTATATHQQVELEWVNPTFGNCLQIIVVRDTTKPTGPLDGVQVANPSCVGELGFKKNATDGGVTNGITYHYAIFVLDGIGNTPGKFLTARPFATAGPGKWAYSTGATTMAPPGLRFKTGIAYVYAVSNDSILHAMNGGLVAPAGTWPVGWTPFKSGAPVQSRPPVVAFPVGGATDGVALLGSQDGAVYAVDANTGLEEWSQTIAPMVLASPAGNFKAFDLGADDIVLVGTRDSAGANSLKALDVMSGIPIWSFDNTSIQGGDDQPIGIISGGAAIDYTTQRVVFGSRQKSGGSPNTVWCVDFSLGPPTLLWARAIGDIDGSPIPNSGVVYVGTNGGDVYALDAGTGNINWSFALADGPIKGFLFPQFGTSNLFVSTSTKVWSLADGGATVAVNPNWPVTTIPSPSTPLYVPGSSDVIVGSGNGNLYQLDVINPASPKLVTLGAGTGAIGAPTLDIINSMIYVGSDEGTIYGVFYPLP